MTLDLIAFLMMVGFTLVTAILFKIWNVMIDLNFDTRKQINQQTTQIRKDLI